MPEWKLLTADEIDGWSASQGFGRGDVIKPKEMKWLCLELIQLPAGRVAEELHIVIDLAINSDSVNQK